ncbi:proton-coupled amino acid transporter-like protein pathetic isoform X1 [Pieris brassicae]|uniref:proton-coupled amino acid transporter-like protein pathetic isoform X1 n=1 Tax=Pieris brassicae TaxID=7116 RepID=UPI001E65F7BD|nr:proton-coupled amino acid transporter-like protein pathetic isoform X1 [Pieris brassicae]
MSEKVNMSETKEGEYNPYEHRKVLKPSSDVRATANIIKASLGSGLLAGPLAFSNSGWATGIVGTFLVGIICGHCIHILVKTSRGCCKIDKKPQLNYAETCESAFANGPKCLRRYAKTASIIAEFSLLSTYVGVCCIYTVLISDSIKQLVDRYVPSVILPVEYYCLIILVPLCLLSQVKYLKWLAIFSLLANLFLVATYVICLYYIFGDEINFSDKKIVGDPARLPAFMSTVIFAMEGIGLVMPVENAMKKPQNFLGCPSVLVVAMSAIVFFYSTLGLFGYFRYGDLARGSITLNLPIDDWLAICAKVFIALSIFFTYPLQFYVVFDIFKRYTDRHVKDNCRNFIDIGGRVIGVCFCVGIGVALPLLEQIINLVGACFYSILGLIIPGIVETVFRWEDLGFLKWVLLKNIFIVAFGFTCLISGCTVTIMDIIEILHNKTVM